MRKALILAFTCLAMLGAAAPAIAGVPDDQMHGVDEVITHNGCGRVTIWLDDEVEYTRAHFWQETDVRVTGYTAFQFDWSCGDRPKPQPPTVTITETMNIPGLNPSLGLEVGASGRLVEGTVAPEFGQKSQGSAERVTTPALEWNASDAYSARWENGHTLTGKGRNASVEHRMTAAISFPDGSNGYRNSFSMDCSDDSRD